MAVADDAGHRDRVEPAGAEGLDDDAAGVLFVIFFQLGRGQVARAGHRAVEIVGMGGAVARDIMPRLRPGHGVGAVGVHNAAESREFAVEFQVGFGVRGRVEVAVHRAAGLQVDDDHVLRREVLVIDAGRLDDHQAALAVDARDVAPGKGDKAVFGQVHVGLPDKFAQTLQHTIFLQYVGPGVSPGGINFYCSVFRGRFLLFGAKFGIFVKVYI